MPPTTRRRPSLADFELATAAVPAVDDRLVHALSLTSIQPSTRNPRQHLNGIDELADSLREHGLLQPVVVRPRGAGYELIAGHRRLEAARVLGWTEIAAVVREETDDQAYVLTLVENLQREDLTPKEEAAALEVLVRERGWTTRQVGEAIKRSHMYVSRRLRVFDDPVLAPLVLGGQLPVSTAEELLRAPGATVRQALARQAVHERWDRPHVRRALRERLESHLERSVPNLLQRVRALTSELATVQPGMLPATARRELARLSRAARRAAQSTAT